MSLWSNAISEDPLALVRKIHGAKMKAGIAISPDTPSMAITDEIGNAVDMILVMTVYPGQWTSFGLRHNLLTSVQVRVGKSSSNDVSQRSLSFVHDSPTRTSQWTEALGPPMLAFVPTQVRPPTFPHLSFS